MNKEFIPYEQALELKHLGFDEVCSFYYKNKVIDDCINAPKTNSVGEFINENFECTAPLYQQAFRWFREKYGLLSFIDNLCLTDTFKYSINWEDSITSLSGYSTYLLSGHSTYEEAELACLKKLIEIAKQK